MTKLRLSKVQQLLISIVLVVLFFFTMDWGRTKYPTDSSVGTIIFLVFLTLTALLWRMSTTLDQRLRIKKNLRKSYSSNTLLGNLILACALIGAYNILKYHL